MDKKFLTILLVITSIILMSGYVQRTENVYENIINKDTILKQWIGSDENTEIVKLCHPDYNESIQPNIYIPFETFLDNTGGTEKIAYSHMWKYVPRKKGPPVI